MSDVEICLFVVGTAAFLYYVALVVFLGLLFMFDKFHEIALLSRRLDYLEKKQQREDYLSVKISDATIKAQGVVFTGQPGEWP